MSYTKLRGVDFGTQSSGLATVGYRLLNADGTTNLARTTAGVVEAPAGSGSYQALVTFPDAFSGKLVWDDGQGSPTYASEFINSGGSADFVTLSQTDTVTQFLLAIGGHNTAVSNQLYDANNNLISAVLRFYDSAAHAILNDGATGLLHSYTVNNVVTNGKPVISSLLLSV